MVNVERDIQLAKTVICDKLQGKIKFGTFQTIYSFSNENLVESLKHFDLHDKDCLTVLASSDQALDMFLSGAKSVTTFDINPLTKYYFYLKKAALLSNISREDYIEFFGYSKNNYFKIFPIVFENLEGEGLKFWYTLFKECDKYDLTHGLFTNEPYPARVLTKTLHYLYGENYYTLASKIKDFDINQIDSNILNLCDKLNSTYDFMYLSNIMEYSKSLFGYDSNDIDFDGKILSLKNFKELVIKLSQKLNANGKINVSYLFEGSCKNRYSDVFHEENFTYNKFPSALRIYCDGLSQDACEELKVADDSCIIYTKK